MFTDKTCGTHFEGILNGLRGAVSYYQSKHLHFLQDVEQPFVDPPHAQIERHGTQLGLTRVFVRLVRSNRLIESAPVLYAQLRDVVNESTFPQFFPIFRNPACHQMIEISNFPGISSGKIEKLAFQFFGAALDSNKIKPF